MFINPWTYTTSRNPLTMSVLGNVFERNYSNLGRVKRVNLWNIANVPVKVLVLRMHDNLKVYRWVCEDFGKRRILSAFYITYNFCSRIYLIHLCILIWSPVFVQMYFSPKNEEKLFLISAWWLEIRTVTFWQLIRKTSIGEVFLTDLLHLIHHFFIYSNKFGSHNISWVKALILKLFILDKHYNKPAQESLLCLQVC